MSEEKVIFGRSGGFFPVFERRPGPIKSNMHYCPGCGHGILHKLIAEAIADFGIQDKTIIIAPVGCAVFSYYYFDCFGISAPHGRAPAVGTGLARANPDNLVISYQGDGDLASIGFNHILQAANRGENLAVFFVNNAIYGMTGGQMAPTTLPGQKTQTTPLGRSVSSEGYPLKVSETVAALDAPVYVERCALSTVQKIRKARLAIRKALTNSIERKGFSLVELLSGCPVNLKMNAQDMNEFLDNQMSRYFPLGVYKDIADSRDPINRPVGIYQPEAVRELLYPVRVADGVSESFRNPSRIFQSERRIKLCGSGGQGVLSLGYMLATMGKLRNFNVSWLPSYGPEMRGGTANCSVVLSRDPIGSPVVDKECNLLLALNQPALEKYLPTLKSNGILLYDESNGKCPDEVLERVIYTLPASDLAKQLGDLKYANSMMLGAVAVMMCDLFLDEEDKADFDRVFEEAIMDCFHEKEHVVKNNIKAFYIGKAKAKRIRN
ncbi:MAG: 2-oxoacid:acceptor oxidoreductase family protein [Victivallales bacterium]|jgi:2-oxoisovalerate ferredoxin oxidoreductase beta subunit|nr:2-oxoacid:acceptor oxidoreductase family protein [Victivallales bacterium]